MERKLTYLGAVGFLSKYIKKYRRRFARFYFGWLFDTLLSCAMPVLFGVMIDEIVYKQNVPLFLRLGGIYVVLAVISCALYFYIYRQHHYLMNMYTLDIKLDVFKHMLKCDAEYLSDMSTGDISTLLQRDSNECMHFIIRNVIHQINRVISIIIIAVWLCKINLTMGLMAMAAAPVSVFINTKSGRKIKEYGNEERRVYGLYMGWLYEILSAVKDIRILGAKDYAGSRFLEYHENMYDVERKAGLGIFAAEKLIELAALIIRLSIYVLAGYLAAKGKLTIGTLTVVISFYGEFASKITEVGGAYLDGRHRVAVIQRICDFLHTPTEDAFDKDRELAVTAGEIAVENVSFSYRNGAQVLSDISLKIKSGERLAITGESGSGKTTFAYLIIGFYRVCSGEIYIDGQRLSECRLRSLRNQVGLVAQEVLIFPGTIRENIMLGNLRASDEELELACRQARLWEVVQKLPKGLDTIIGTAESDLSGGQKQRIAIARIYLRNPKIIIFDEATSSLDAATERDIHDAWNKALKGRTAIIITHRESTLMYCDRVIRFAGGRICQES